MLYYRQGLMVSIVIVQCAPGIRCDPIEKLANGGRTAESRVAGSLVAFYCNTGFKLSATLPLLCEENAQWNGTVPRCLGKANKKLYVCQTTIDVYMSKLPHSWSPFVCKSVEMSFEARRS